MARKVQRRPSALTTSRKDGTHNNGGLINTAIVAHELEARNGEREE